MLEEKLQNIGLTDKEAKVYLKILELGEASVQDIAKHAKVNRITTHVAIEKLQKEGLVKEVQKGKRRRIIAEMPQRLIDRLLDKKTAINRQASELTKLLPELESMYNYSEVKPKIRFFEGFDGLQRIYQDTLDTGEEILAFTAYHRADKQLAKWLDEYYIPERVKRNIFAKVIAPSSDFAENYQGVDTKHKRQTALISAQDYPMSIEVNIYGSKIAIMSFTSAEMMGVIIESQEVATTFALIFKLAWQSAIDSTT